MAIASGREGIPDISRINEDRIREIMDDLRGEALDRRCATVSSTPFIFP